MCHSKKLRVGNLYFPPFTIRNKISKKGVSLRWWSCEIWRVAFPCYYELVVKVVHLYWWWPGPGFLYLIPLLKVRRNTVGPRRPGPCHLLVLLVFPSVRVISWFYLNCIPDLKSFRFWVWFLIFVADREKPSRYLSAFLPPITSRLSLSIVELSALLQDKTRLAYGSIFSQQSKVRFYCCATPRTIFSIKYRIKTLWSVEKRVREGIHLFQVEFVKSNEEHHCEKSRTSFVILLFMQISLLPLLVVFHKSNVSIGDQTHIVIIYKPIQMRKMTPFLKKYAGS